MNIAYYITPHGFGHAVRSLEVIRVLLEKDPQLHVTIVSDLPEYLVTQNVGRPLPLRRKRLDLGLVQRDSLRFDLDATHAALMDLYDARERIVEEEVEFLRAARIAGVVCDVPFLPFVAAERCGIPSVGLGNFTWDWIYGGYAASDSRWEFLVSWIREIYGRCGLFLQLPMHGDCSACPNIESVPLVARRANRMREETRAVLGCPQDVRAYLIAFTALDLSMNAQKRLERISNAVFFYKRPLRYRFANGRSLDAVEELSYADVVAAMDGVITKPGYGIVTDCLVHGVPMLYTDRGFFPEYEILVETMEQHLTISYIPSDGLYAGEWEDALGRLESLPRRVSHLDDRGAEVCADRILRAIRR